MVLAPVHRRQLSQSVNRKKGVVMHQNSWGHLSKQQVGAYAEYFVKMELTLHGCQVFTPEVDDRGVDFVARYALGPFFEVQVKSTRKLSYVYLDKHKTTLRESLYLGLVLLTEGAPPDLYLVPSLVWANPNGLFVSRDYDGLPSKPDWGLNLSKKNLPLLEPYGFRKMARHLSGCG